MANRYYPNMNLVRYFMAFGVLIAHYNILTGHDIPYPITPFERLGGFFAMSGFLMYPSFCKTMSAKKYIINRAIRLMPAYYFAVFFCAFGLSTISTLSYQEYFCSADFWSYLIANITTLNWLHPDLPGVFQGDEYVMSVVDGSLWTMKVEWTLSLSVPLVLLTIKRFDLNKVYWLLGLVVLSYIYRLWLQNLYESTGKQIYAIMGKQFFGQLSYFYLGMIIYFIQDQVYKYKNYIILIGIPIYILTRNIEYSNIILAPILLTLLTLSISMLPWNFSGSRSDMNLSYNIYLLHFPIIQLSIYWGINKAPEWLSFGFVVLATLLLSLISYYLVERHFYKLRTRI